MIYGINKLIRCATTWQCVYLKVICNVSGVMNFEWDQLNLW